MEKNKIMKIVVLLVGMVMALNIAYPYLSALIRMMGNNNGVSGDVVKGIASFEASIRTYDPFLIVPANTSMEILNELEGMEGYRGKSAVSGAIRIDTMTRDDVVEIARFLSSKGVIPYGVANVITPPKMNVDLGDKKIEANVLVSSLKVYVPVLFDVDEGIPLNAIVDVSEDSVVGYESAEMDVKNKKVEFSGKVKEVKSKEHVYKIAWDKRDVIDRVAGMLSNDSGEGGNDSNGNVKVMYEKNDMVYFNIPLTPSEIIEKRSLEYVEYIDKSSIKVNENFTNKSKIESDFEGHSPVFPESTISLLITGGNESELVESDILDILEDNKEDETFNYVYDVEISNGRELNGNEGEYIVYINFEQKKDVEVKTNEKFDEGDELLVEIDGVAVGNRIVKIKEINVKND